MNIAGIKAYGPWVLVKVDKPPEVSSGGLYLPQGNVEQRTGHSTARVLSVGQGKRSKKSPYDFVPSGIREGDTVLFRGFLKDANQPDYTVDRDICLIHVDDIVGVVDVPSSSE